MKKAGWLLLFAAVLAALAFVPDGLILSEFNNAYYTGTAADSSIRLQPYGGMLALGTFLAAGVFFLLRLWKEQEKSAAFSRCIAFIGSAAFFGFVFSRLLYCLTSLIFYLRQAGITAVFRWWEGGMSMTGALLGIALGGFLTIRRDSRSWESAVPAAAILIACARFAETFGFLGRGMDVDWEGFLTIADPYGFGNVLNVWFIELTVVLVICAALLLWKRFSSGCPRGVWFAAASLIVYCTVQILMESLRADRHMIWGFVKSQQLFSFLLAFACLLLFALRRSRITLTVVSSLALAGAVFSLEKALDRLPVSPIWLYLVFIALLFCYLSFAVSVITSPETARRAGQNR